MKFMEFPLSTKSMSTYTHTHHFIYTVEKKNVFLCVTELIIYVHILSINDKLLTLKMSKNRKKKTVHKIYTLIVFEKLSNRIDKQKKFQVMNRVVSAKLTKSLTGNYGVGLVYKLSDNRKHSAAAIIVTGKAKQYKQKKKKVLNGTLEMQFLKHSYPVPQTMANNLDLNHFFLWCHRVYT